MQALEPILKPLLILGAGLYAGAFITLLRKRTCRWGIGLFASAWTLNATIFVINWIACGHPPFGNMYHVLVVLAGLFLPLYGIHWLQDRSSGLLPAFAVAGALPLVGACFLIRKGSDFAWKRMPALQSPWFVPHVFAYMVSYALALIAFLVIAVKLVQRARRNQEAAHQLTEGARRLIRMSMPFMTFGMLSGALWAEEVWGNYWSWDPKETWSLITWTLYMIYLHCHLDPKLKHLTDTVQALGFLALVTTLTLVNYLSAFASLLHSYA